MNTYGACCFNTQANGPTLRNSTQSGISRGASVKTISETHIWFKAEDVGARYIKAFNEAAGGNQCGRAQVNS